MVDGSLQLYVNLAWLCWITPIVGALITPLLAKVGDKVRDYGAVAFSLAATLMALMLLPLLFYHVEELPLHSQVSWVEAPGVPVLRELKAGVLLDPLSIIMANVVAFISFLIMVYSLGYMHGEEGLTRYWFFMNFFIGNMLLLVLSDNLIQMLFGWEGVGLCSYALIGFWYRDSKKDWLKCWVGEGKEAYPPSHCGLKAFMFTKFGDLFMILGLLIILAYTGTLEFLKLETAVKTVPVSILLLASLLLLGGPIGKSAQLPLMEWLPDAMAGPTTVSALIHAATMVKAGVYLIARMFPIIYNAAWSGGSPNQLIEFFYAVAWIGAITAFVAATQASTSTELKKVLAYSTVSQIGYMMLGLGVAGLTANFVLGYAGSIFHLISHALFKAALFLAAGAILHAVHSRFLYHMGGLREYMPKTFIFMVLAAFSLMGVPLFSGFWSKDMILEASLAAGEPLIFIIGVGTAGITCFYTVRMLGLVFMGDRRSEVKPHEAPLIMLVPYAILTAISIGLGVVGFLVKDWLESTFHEYLGFSLKLVRGYPNSYDSSAMVATLISSLAMLVIGGYAAYLVYVRRKPSPESLLKNRPWLSALRSFFLKRWYINRLYYFLFVSIPVSVSRWFFENVERPIFDGFNYFVASKVLALSGSFRKTHTGILSYNVLSMVLGILIVFILLLMDLLMGVLA
ncbi:NADH-quinone oxidoreductase subunit L [Candidatus Bathyarchaeota archaeon]|nr:MAG: NADH-quinone oxidoreductase subunit L [Candidatus Bathyarchaeota archaeon]